MHANFTKNIHVGFKVIIAGKVVVIPSWKNMINKRRISSIVSPRQKVCIDHNYIGICKMIYSLACKARCRARHSYVCIYIYIYIALVQCQSKTVPVYIEI